MNTTAKLSANCAIVALQHGHHADAIYHLRQALRGTRNPRAKSKLMLAIRECNRALRAAS